MKIIQSKSIRIQKVKRPNPKKGITRLQPTREIPQITLGIKDLKPENPSSSSSIRRIKIMIHLKVHLAVSQVKRLALAKKMRIQIQMMRNRESANIKLRVSSLLSC
jgi:hypothetical protein